MRTTKILFIRHGETEDNLAGKIQGHRPGKLTAKGRRQAAGLVDFLVRYKVDAVYASDLVRAQETARLAVVGLPGARILNDSRLREQDFGRLEGQPRATAFRALLKDGVDRETKTHVIGFIKEIIGTRQGQTVAAFTHFGPIFAVLREFSATDAATCLRDLRPGVSVMLEASGENRFSVYLVNGEQTFVRHLS